MPALLNGAAAVLLALGAAAAGAHDTWFEPLGATPRGELSLALGTGNQFPAQEIPVALEQLQASGCEGDGVRAAPLRRLAERPNALVLRSARPVPATATLACWAQLVPIDVDIAPDRVDVYLDEIRASAAVRARWAALQARGVTWQERYVKHARIEIDGAAAPGDPAAPAPGPLTAPAAPIGMDVRLSAARRPLRAGDEVEFQVLRDGQPLAGQPMELRSDLSPLGVWRETDADGRVRLTVPLAGRWVLRGVDLRTSSLHPDHWESRFVTLAFEVQSK